MKEIIVKGLISLLIFSFILMTHSAWSATCDKSEIIVNKIVTAAIKGDPPPKINAKVFSKTKSGSVKEKYVEIVVEDGKVYKMSNGKKTLIDPKEVPTMRAFTKNANGENVHSFVTNPKLGQEAVDSFFKTTPIGKVNNSEVTTIFKKFTGMSEMEQATLVGGIENKLRAGKSITESEFLIAVKATPSFRTLPGIMSTHLDDLRAAFRTGNLTKALAGISQSWGAAKASAQTKGRVSRIQSLLIQNKKNAIQAKANLAESTEVQTLRGPRTVSDKQLAVIPVKSGTALKPKGGNLVVQTKMGQLMPKQSQIAKGTVRNKGIIIEGEIVQTEKAALALTVQKSQAAVITTGKVKALTAVKKKA